MMTDVGMAARDWLAGVLPPGWLSAVDAGDRVLLDRLRPQLDPEMFRVKLGRSGYGTPSWPRRFGGLELDLEQSAEVQAILLRYEVPQNLADSVTWKLAGPTILQWGTPEQKERYLRPMARTEERWCQLFSEPGAGSDLAGLTTRAVPDGDGWRVTGQKVWSSFAHLAHFGLLLARTDPTQPKHRGITYFICDLSSPGVEIRPLRSMTGDSEFNEVFLDSVLIPASDRIGPVDGGWKVAMSTVQSERDALSGVPVVGRGATDELLEAFCSDPSTAIGMRDRIVSLLVAERALQIRRLFDHCRPPSARTGVEESVTKLLQTRLTQRISEAAIDFAGASGQAWALETPPAVVQEFLLARALTIAGGTSEIQKTIIAERALGLPREEDDSRTRPWQDTRR